MIKELVDHFFLHVLLLDTINCNCKKEPPKKVTVHNNHHQEERT